MTVIQDEWYNHPRYYDISFREETREEADFIEAAAKRYDGKPPRRLLEPACGSGRLVVEMARRGYHVSAFDRSEPSLRYLNLRLKRAKLSADVFQGDLEDFQIKKPVDLAFCYCNTFRHLLTERDALRHLRCVAAALRPGGLYLLGLHIMPPDADPFDEESWTSTHRGVTVHTQLTITATDARRRVETMRVELTVTERGERRVIQHEMPMRIYNAKQLKKLVDAATEFELVGVHDFNYEIDRPYSLDDDMADTLLVLRRRAM